MAHLEGGCLCGKVRYSADAEPIFVGVCHCTDCQKISGSAYSTVLGIPADALKVTGTTKTFTKPGDSGQPTHRYFCPECGSALLHDAAVMPGVMMINVGTLDDPSMVKPGMQIYCDSAQSWAKLPPGTQSFPKMPG
jgi:hypothetical protein